MSRRLGNHKPSPPLTTGSHSVTPFSQLNRGDKEVEKELKSHGVVLIFLRSSTCFNFSCPTRSFVRFHHKNPSAISACDQQYLQAASCTRYALWCIFLTQCNDCDTAFNSRTVLDLKRFQYYRLWANETGTPIDGCSRSKVAEFFLSYFWNLPWYSLFIGWFLFPYLLRNRRWCNQLDPWSIKCNADVLYRQSSMFSAHKLFCGWVACHCMRGHSQATCFFSVWPAPLFHFQAARKKKADYTS